MSGDSTEFLGFVRRIMRATGARIADADPDDLAEMLGLRDELDNAINQAVAGMRQNGFTWQQIADAAGITRQTAHGKWRQVEPDSKSTKGSDPV